MQHCSAIHRNLLVSFIYYKIKKIQNTASLLHSCFHPYVTSTRAYGQNCTRGRKYLLPPSLPQTWRNFRYIRCRTPKVAYSMSCAHYERDNKCNVMCHARHYCYASFNKYTHHKGTQLYQRAHDERTGQYGSKGG